MNDSLIIIIWLIGIPIAVFLTYGLVIVPVAIQDTMTTECHKMGYEHYVMDGQASRCVNYSGNKIDVYYTESLNISISPWRWLWGGVGLLRRINGGRD